MKEKTESRKHIGNTMSIYDAEYREPKGVVSTPSKKERIWHRATQRMKRKRKWWLEHRCRAQGHLWGSKVLELHAGSGIKEVELAHIQRNKQTERQIYRKADRRLTDR
jgi:hypothetical protein